MGNINQNPAGPIGVHNGSLPWEVTVGGLLQEVYHGSFPWEFTALTYFEALYLFWVIDILRTLKGYHSLSIVTIDLVGDNREFDVWVLQVGHG